MLRAFMEENASSNSKPFVSVVVPCYNGMRTVGDCLSSLANQSYPRDRFEVLVADNGSTDGTCEYIRESFPWVNLVHSTQKGSGYARNAGIEQAHGVLILSTDSDCIVDKDWIVGLVSAFEVASTDVAAIGGPIMPYSLKTSVEYHRPAWPSQPDLDKMPPGVRFAATPNAAFRTSALTHVGAFDGTLGFDDTDLGIRLLQNGYKVEYTMLAVVRHRNPVTLAELYRHRVKYGTFGFTLSRKHPKILGDPMALGAQRKLFFATLRRVVGDLLVKLPVALVAAPPNQSRIWPLIDATMALGNLAGYSRASATAQKSL
jgi:O-antigen biosynthesis protein